MTGEEPECVVNDDCPDCWEMCIEGVCEWFSCGDVLIELAPTAPNGCTFDLEERPNAPPLPGVIDLVELHLPGQTLAVPLEISSEVCGAGEVDGWIWLDYGLELQVCGEPCAVVQEQGYVDAKYSCPACPGW